MDRPFSTKMCGSPFATGCLRLIHKAKDARAYVTFGGGFKIVVHMV